MRYFLGIDVGSTKTHAMIADETGHFVGFGKAWGGNHQNVGYDGLSKVLRESFVQAGQMAGVHADLIAGAGPSGLQDTIFHLTASHTCR